VSTAIGLFLVLTLLLTAAFCAILFDVTSTVETGDRAMGQGIEWLYAIVLLVLAWGSLGGLLWCGRSVLPSWAGAVAAIVWLVSGVSAAMSFYVLSPQVRWPILMPAGVPVLLAAYVLLLSAAATRPWAASQPVSVGLWTAVFLLTLSIWPAAIYKMGERGRTAAAYRAEMADPVKKAERRDSSLKKIASMTPDQPLEQWRDLLLPENGARAEAIEALRKVDRRQEDIEQLARHDGVFLAAIPELDLKLTPLLCNATSDYIFNRAFVRQLQGDRKQRFGADESDDALVAAVGWFQSRGCDCRASLDKYARDIEKSFPDSPERREFLEVLARLKEAR
jgi:hypothetical protein